MSIFMRAFIHKNPYISIDNEPNLSDWHKAFFSVLGHTSGYVVERSDVYALYYRLSIEKGFTPVTEWTFNRTIYWSSPYYGWHFSPDGRQIYGINCAHIPSMEIDKTSQIEKQLAAVRKQIARLGGGPICTTSANVWIPQPYHRSKTKKLQNAIRKERIITRWLRTVALPQFRPMDQFGYDAIDTIYRAPSMKHVLLEIAERGGDLSVICDALEVSEGGWFRACDQSQLIDNLDLHYYLMGLPREK